MLSKNAVERLKKPKVRIRSTSEFDRQSAIVFHGQYLRDKESEFTKQKNQ